MAVGIRTAGVVVAEAVGELTGRAKHAGVAALDHILGHRDHAAAALVIVAAVLLRLALIVAGWPGTDSDESTMGLMAIHILRRGEHPIFFYGQAYMGSVEAHLAALLFAVFGVSLVALKGALVILYTGFLVAMWLLLRRLVGPRRAVFGLALLVFGGDDLLGLELHAFGGYLETLCCGALLTLLTVMLAGPRRERGATLPSARRARAVTFAAWGLVAGLGIYSDPLVLPFVACAALGLAVACWPELRGRLGAVALAALLLGVSPWVIYDLTAGTPGAASSFLQHPAARQAPSTSPAGPGAGELLVDHIFGTVVVAVPDIAGGEVLFPVRADTWPPARWSTPSERLAALVRGLWGMGVLAAMGVAIWLEGRSLRRVLRSPPASWSSDERARAACAIGCLIPLVAGAITVVAFTASDASAFAPWIYSRYLVGLLIALPVAVATLWVRLDERWVASPAAGEPPHVGTLRWRVRGFGLGPISRRTLRRVARGAVILLLLAALAVPIAGTLATVREIPAQRAQNQAQAELVATLLAHGQTRVYSEFWTCYWVIFTSDERILCGVLNGDLSRRASRYAPYDSAIDAARPSVYVFPIGSAQATALPGWAAAQHQRVSAQVVAGQFVVFTHAPD